MIRYNIHEFPRMDMISGKVYKPMKQWLNLHGEQSVHYDYSHDLAIISHYLQNRVHPEADAYRNEAIELMGRYYRASHTDLIHGNYTQEHIAETLFRQLAEAPLMQQFQNNNDFTFIDLFAGVGGFRIALEQLGGRCVFCSEIDKAAKKTYAWNHGVIPFGDITRQDIQERIPIGYDVLCAGFPCQPFSMAGLRRGFDDPVKGTLFFEIIKILDRTHPRAVFLENVPGLLSIRNDDDTLTIETIIDVLELHHYHVANPKIVDACNFGTAQKRERVFIAAFREQDAQDFEYPTGEGIDDMHFGDIQEAGIVPTSYYMSNRYWNTLQNHRVTQRAQGRGYGFRTITANDFCHTLLVGGMGLERNLIVDIRNPYVNNVEDPRGELNHDFIRVLTERECARAQGFPENFELNATTRGAAYKQFGNSVAIPAVREMARAILEYAGIDYHDIQN